MNEATNDSVASKNQHTQKRLLLTDTLPVFSTELRQLLEVQGESELAAQVPGLMAGAVFFACEQAPRATFRNRGLPARCPVCGMQNPFGGEADDNQQR
jgi:hypothetical protein